VTGGWGIALFAIAAWIAAAALIVWLLARYHW